MAAATLSFRSSVLPWALSHEDEQRFRRILVGTVLFALCFGLVLPWLPHPEAAPEKAQALPPPIAKLLLERPVSPPPPPPTPATKIEPPKPNPADKTEPAPLPTKPVPKERPVVEARNPVPNKPPGEALEAARNRAAGVGLLAMKDQLAEMHGAPLAVQLNQDIKPGKGVGAGEGVGVGAGREAGLPDRNLITSNATGGSGGINTAGYSRDTGGGGLAGRSTTLVAGVAGGGGGGGPGAGGQIAGTGGHGTGTGYGKSGGTIQRGASGKASRSLEEVRLVLERNKGALYSIYNRALREDPTLQGKVVIELTIAPAGAVTSVKLVSSELKSPELEQKLLARFRLLEFRPEEVDTLVTTYPIDFLPS
jgi:TonB family protein